ncbi:MAG: sodium:glutamate symporter [Moorea sp. SIO2B7]|nr:sodium:glutamate symporter [Moorena sp. SIO2B7]
MFTLKDVFFAFIFIGLLILIGRLIQQKVRWMQKLYLPESVVAGFLALLLGPEFLGAIVSHFGGDELIIAQGLFLEPIREVWQQAPSVFINIVFAALFLGESIPKPKEIWRKAAPQVIFGQSLAWGQYVVGISLTLLILVPLFHINPTAGALIEIAFEGGHGTAAGMQDTFANLNFPEGEDLALGLATVGIVSGIVAGTFLANWGRKKGYIQTFQKEGQHLPEYEGIAREECQEDETELMRLKRAQLMQNLLIDPLSLNFGFVSLAVAIGWLILKALVGIESLTWGQTGLELMVYIPLFPMTLVGGIILQLILRKLGLDALIMRSVMNNLAGLALDIVVVTALASISLKVLGSNLGPFLILSIAGIIWNIFAFVYLAPRLIPSYWFERGIGDMGQSMGVTATGILLLRMVDPENKSGAFESFAYKQLFFEPIVGGGLFTATAPILIIQFGSVAILVLTAILLAFWLIVGFTLFGKSARQARLAEKCNKQ